MTSNLSLPPPKCWDHRPVAPHLLSAELGDWTQGFIRAGQALHLSYIPNPQMVAVLMGKVVNLNLPESKHKTAPKLQIPLFPACSRPDFDPLAAQKKKILLYVVAHICSVNTQEAERNLKPTWSTFHALGQLGLHSETLPTNKQKTKPKQKNKHCASYFSCNSLTI